jgi:UDP-glucuronate 4-epimerase
VRIFGYALAVLKSKSALVTGGAGFIGSHVADRLLFDGWRVTAFDNFDPYYDPEQKRRNVARALGQNAYRLVEADVRDAAALSTAMDEAEPDLVIHLAARAGVRASIADPRSYVEVNELGGLNVLEACRTRGLLPLVYASTSSAYGNSPRIPFCEDDPAVSPLSPYAASKRSGELMAHAFHHLHALPIAVLRFFTVYGPRGRPDMAFWTFTEALLRGQPIRLHGSDTERDFTYVDDIVDGVLGAVRWLGETRGHDTFNLGRSEPVRVRRLIELLGAALGRPPSIVEGELQAGESRTTFADVSRAAGALGYAPQVSLEEGVRRWVDWLSTSDEAPGPLRAALRGS